MPIKKRRTPEERFEHAVGSDWKRAIKHPLLAGIVRFAKYDTRPVSLAKAIDNVKGWKGASYHDKVFVFLLASVLYRANGESFISDSTYDRLRDHLYKHADDVLERCGLQYHQPLVWHHRKVCRIPVGELQLPTLNGQMRKRRKLNRHRK